MKSDLKVSALATLCELRNGRTMSELDESIAEVVDAVRRTGKPGQVRVTLSIKPFSKGKSEEEVQVVAIEDSIQTKLPQLDRGTTMFFSSEAGLQRNNPSQMEIDLKKVPEPEPAASAPLKVLDGGKAVG